MSAPNPRPSARITGDLRCAECGYRLIGLELRDNCPECGLAIERSLRSKIDLGSLEGRPLESARTIATSITMLAVGFCLALLTRPIVSLTIAFRPIDTGRTLYDSDLVPLRTAIAITAAVGLLGVLLMALSRRVIAHVASERPLPPKRRILVIWVVGCLVLVDLLLLAIPFAPTAWLIDQGRTPRLSWMLAALLLLRTLGHGTLLVLLCQALSSIGWRSDRYRRAGNALQAAGPMLATLAVECVTLAAWMLRGTLGPLLPSETSSGPFLVVWLIFSTLVAVGGIYLLMNTIWVVQPLFQAQNRLGELVGLESAAKTASMADHDRDDRSP